MAVRRAGPLPCCHCLHMPKLLRLAPENYPLPVCLEGGWSWEEGLGVKMSWACRCTG